MSLSRVARLSISALSLACAGSMSPAQTPGFSYIGSLGGRGQEVMTVSAVAPGPVVYGVNNYYPSNSPYFRRAWIWSPATGADPLPGTPASGTSSGVYAASADGSVVVGILGIAPGQPGTNPVVFRRVNGGADEILPLAAGMTSPQVMEISDDGMVAVGFVNGYGGGGRPVRWVGTQTAEMLPVFGAGPSARAFGVSGDGRVIVGWSGFGYPFDQVAVRWVDGQVESLGIPAGSVRTWATGVSGDGNTIVGVAEGSGLSQRAFKWTPSEGMTILPDNGSPYSGAASISADGRLISGRAGNDAVVWKDGALYRVQADLIPPGTSVAPFANLAGSPRISRDGTTIASSELVIEAPGDGEYHCWAVVLPLWMNTCPGDFNSDGGVDGDDVIAFFEEWDAGAAGADFTQDGGVDGDDVIGFFQHWDTGC